MQALRIAIVALTIGLAIAAARAADCNTECPPMMSGPIKVYRIDLDTFPFPESIVACHASGADFTISVAGWTGNNLIHIADCVGDGQNSIGRVTIQGDLGTDATLFVFVAAANSNLLSRESYLDDFYPGCLNFGGLMVSAPVTLARTRASIFAAGDIEHRGAPNDVDIHVNQVVRIRAYPSTPETGVINANILAQGSGFPFIAGDPHIGWVAAGLGINGRIEAVNGDIFAVRVLADPAASPTGIQGDILAPNGRISSIYTSGPIGDGAANPPITPKIYAHAGIEQIRTVWDDPATPGSTNPASAGIRADIQASIGFDAPVPTSIGAPAAHAAIHIVQSGGDIDGSIRAKNISGTNTGLGHQGIFAAGTITAPIDLELTLDRADIIAASITGPISIGVHCEGAIVATDEVNGRIVSVTIGRLMGSASADAGDYATFFPRGMSGAGIVPVPLWERPPNDLFTHEDWAPSVGLPLCLDHGSTDSVIRARTIGSIDIAAMTLLYAASNPPSSVPAKTNPPRIEAEVIDHLVIGDMRNGVVWSGNLDLNIAGSPPSNDPADDFAHIVDSEIKCMGWGAKLWVDGTTDVHVAGDMLGEVHAPQLRAGTTISIGGKLGSWADECGCEPFIPTCLLPPNPVSDIGGCFGRSPFVESSPRDTFADIAEQTGVVRIHDQSGLHGQVIINADNLSLPATDLWKGHVAVGGKIIGPVPSDADLESPYYTRPSPDLGGGAVGLAPFHLYGTDCVPPHDPGAAGSGVDEKEINGFEVVNPVLGDDNTIRVRFYGPLQPKSSWTSSVKVRARPFPPGCQPWPEPISGNGLCN